MSHEENMDNISCSELSTIGKGDVTIPNSNKHCDCNKKGYNCDKNERNAVVETVDQMHDVCSFVVQQFEQTKSFIDSVKHIQCMSGKDGFLVEQISKYKQRVTSLEEELRLLNKGLQDIKSENSSVRSDLQNKELECSKLLSEINQFKKERKKVESELVKKDEKVSSFEKQVISLVKRLDQNDIMQRKYKDKISELIKETKEKSSGTKGKEKVHSKKCQETQTDSQTAVNEQIQPVSETTDNVDIEYKRKRQDAGNQITKEKQGIGKELEEFKDKYKNKTKELEDIKREYKEKLDASEKEKETMKETAGKVLQQIKREYSGKLANYEKEKQQLHKSERWMKEKIDSQSREMEQSQRECTEIRKEKEHLTDRLSQMMNQRFNTDESDVENVNIKNRPLKLVEEYEMFCSDAWLQAKLALDQCAQTAACFPLSEEKKNKILVDIIMHTFKMCEITVTKQQKELEMCLNTPFRNRENHRKSLIEVIDSSTPRKKLPEELNLAITKYLKLNADDIDCDNVGQDILYTHLKQISEGELNKEAIQSPDLIGFVEAICKLSWKMSIQKPPMFFLAGDIGKPFDDNKHELAFGSLDPKQAVIAYYIYPSLFHGKTLLKKGKVMLQ